MTPKKIKEEIREKSIDLKSFEQMAMTSDEMDKTYKPLIETYRTQIQELEVQLTSKKKKVKVEYWKPESKGEIDKSFFEDKPYLTVSVHKSIIKRPAYESIRKYWFGVSNERCETLVEEKGYVVGVISNVVIGVIQVSGWTRIEIRDGENQGRVEFSGEMLSDHKSIDYTLKDRTVSGPVQGFNFSDEDK